MTNASGVKNRPQNQLPILVVPKNVKENSTSGVTGEEK